MDYDVLVLIAGGIGVTPMVSILRHLVHQLGAHRCAHCNKVRHLLLLSRVRWWPACGVQHREHTSFVMRGRR